MAPTLPPEEKLTVKNDPEGDDMAALIDQECKKGEDEAPTPDFDEFDLDEETAKEEADLSTKSDEEDDFEEADPIEDGLEDPAELPDDSDEEATIEEESK